MSFDFFIGGFSPNLVNEGNKKSASTFSEVSFTIPRHIASAICLFGINSDTDIPPFLERLTLLSNLIGPILNIVLQDNLCLLPSRRTHLDLATGFDALKNEFKFKSSIKRQKAGCGLVALTATSQSHSFSFHVEITPPNFEDFS